MRASIAAVLLLAACGETDGAGPEPGDKGSSGQDSPGWTMDRSGGGAALALAGASGTPQIRIICTPDGRLLVNVPGFRPVGSEERMTFGSGGSAETLVADSAGDPARGGVTAGGPVPQSLDALLSGQVAANYGAQDSGPHAPVPQAMLAKFTAACRPGETGPDGKAEQDRESVSACLVQDGKRVPAMNLRAIGTEPFWAADVKGRCVTYKTPENQQGRRVWTQFSGSASNGRWAGALDGRPFVMTSRAEARCSDGMSDTVYPIAIELDVGGEQRRGCAEPRD